VNAEIVYHSKSVISVTCVELSTSLGGSSRRQGGFGDIGSRARGMDVVEVRVRLHVTCPLPLRSGQAFEFVRLRPHFARDDRAA
jgi:hypothetical protein